MLREITSTVLVGLLLFYSTTATAQEKKERRIPSLVTEELVALPVQSKSDTESRQSTDSRNNRTDDEAKTDSITKPGAKKTEDPAETEWKQRLREAQEKAKTLERNADQVELEIIQVRNQRYNNSNQAASALNEGTARIETLTRRNQELRKQAATSQAEVQKMLDEGNKAGYQTQAQASGNNNDSRDNTENANADNTQDIRDLETRQQVIQNRINQISAKIRQTMGSGDNFALNRLRQELRQEQANLEDTRAKAEASRKKLP
ncbi:MAG: hypothetical protein ACKV2V_08895 [Blastocatellia bacterium]